MVIFTLRMLKAVRQTGCGPMHGVKTRQGITRAIATDYV